MFSAFWDEAYLKHFDGERLLVPSVRPGTDMSELKLLGTILSHGFMVCGFLPIRIAFPVVVATLLGPNVEIPDIILLESFVDFLSSHDSTILKDAVLQVQSNQFITSDVKSSLIDLLSRFGCTEMPTRNNLLRLIVGVAKHNFVGKPLGSLFTLRAGVPIQYGLFWDNYTIQKLFELYKALNATTVTVLKLLTEPEGMNAAQERVYCYLITLVQNMKNDELRCFVRFITGSSVVVAKHIAISFNNLSGLARRPISHTCDCGLELPVAYSTFPEFEKGFIQ